MLSVVEQRAGAWGALMVVASAADGTPQVATAEDERPLTSPEYVDGNLSCAQQSPVDSPSPSYDLPSVRLSFGILNSSSFNFSIPLVL